MSTTIAQSSILESTPEISSQFPAWFSEQQQQGWADFQSLPMPSRGDEVWRFGNLKQLDFSEFTEEEVNKIEFQIPSLPEGVICLPLEEALQAHGDLVQEHFMKSDIRLGSAKFGALHKAKVKNGLFVYVPDGVKVAEPIEVSHVLSGACLLYTSPSPRDLSTSRMPSSA